jgi:membrane protease YdiL (CAAX protease family)
LQSVPRISSTETSPPTCDPWKFWASIAWTITALVGPFVLVLFYLFVSGSPRLEGAREYASTLHLEIASTLMSVVVLALAIQLAHCRFSNYLALYRPRWKDLVLSAVCFAVLFALMALLPDFSDHNPSLDDYEQAREAEVLFLWSLDTVIVAPIVEEIVFRGFLWRGLAASRVGIPGAMIVSAAGWAALHIQYDVVGIAEIGVLGLFFGWVRWRFGSTILTMILHGLNNGVFLAAIVAGLA